MTYNPEDYWSNRGKNYQAPGEILEQPEVENLKKIVEHLTDDDSKFLEVGSGYGRIYEALKSERLCSNYNYHMCDFVESMRYNCLRATNRMPDSWNGKTLPYMDKQFDLVISFSVFLHVPPCEIERVFAEHVRVCKKHLFIATYFGGLERLAEHCFEHDYYSLFDKYGLGVVEQKFFQKGLRVNWLLEI